MELNIMNEYKYKYKYKYSLLLVSEPCSIKTVNPVQGERSQRALRPSPPKCARYLGETRRGGNKGCMFERRIIL